jgi:hypothetical protein
MTATKTPNPDDPIPIDQTLIGCKVAADSALRLQIAHCQRNADNKKDHPCVP